MDQSRMKIVYVITERGSSKYWNRVGVAFVNNDGSLNVKLEAVPVSGEMQIRDYSPREEGVVPASPRTKLKNGASAQLAESA